MGKASKATKKFVSSGQLKKTIQARHKKQQIQKKFEKRRGNKSSKGKERTVVEDEEAGDDDDAEGAQEGSVNFLGFLDFSCFLNLCFEQVKTNDCG